MSQSQWDVTKSPSHRRRCNQNQNHNPTQTAALLEVASSSLGVQSVNDNRSSALVLNTESTHLMEIAMHEKCHLQDSSSQKPYRDFSSIATSLNQFLPPAEGKEAPFPLKLHRILSNPDFNEYIAWQPHGRSWRILRPKAFAEKVIPLYFRHTKHASFMRQVNGWGFTRVITGPDQNSYYHELFLKGLPKLCLRMRRPPSRSKQATLNDDHPNFYQVPLLTKNQKGSVHSKALMIDNMDTSESLDDSRFSFQRREERFGANQKNSFGNQADMEIYKELDPLCSNLVFNKINEPGIAITQPTERNLYDKTNEVILSLKAKIKRQEEILAQIQIAQKSNFSSDSNYTNGNML